MLYRVSLTGKDDQFSVPQLGYLGYHLAQQRSKRIQHYPPGASRISDDGPLRGVGQQLQQLFPTSTHRKEKGDELLFISCSQASSSPPFFAPSSEKVPTAVRRPRREDFPCPRAQESG